MVCLPAHALPSIPSQVHRGLSWRTSGRATGSRGLRRRTPSPPHCSCIAASSSFRPQPRTRKPPRPSHSTKLSPPMVPVSLAELTAETTINLSE